MIEKKDYKLLLGLYEKDGSILSDWGFNKSEIPRVLVELENLKNTLINIYNEKYRKETITKK